MSNKFSSDHSETEFENADQTLSELLDDRASSESLEAILSSEEAANTWYRYNLVRSVLHKEHSAHSSFEFTQSIAAQIALEPSIIAQPKAKSPSAPSNYANVISLWKKSVSGFAIAASVAFAMVFSVQMMNAPEQSQQSVAAETGESNSAFSVASESDVAEQAKLDEIQAILNSIGKSNLNVNEQLVGGERIVSKVIKSNQLEELERQVRNMKRPSEAESKD